MSKEQDTINPAGSPIIKNVPSPPQPKTDGSNDEYDRFEDLTRKVVAVPKEEVDEKRGK